jgi:hypothetical protein
VVIFGVDQGQASWARFYLEPVQEGGGGVDEALHRTVVPVSDMQAGSAERGRDGKP